MWYPLHTRRPPEKNRPQRQRCIRDSWITPPQTQQLTHKWRAEEDAILVGAQTAITDNPSLTVRESLGKHPTRVVLDPHNRVPAHARVFDGEAPCLHFSKSALPDPKGSRTEHILLEEDAVPSVLSHLHERGIQSLIVEGGRHTLQSFIDAQLWDEARILTGQPIFGSGLSAPTLHGTAKERYRFGKDEIQHIFRT